MYNDPTLTDLHQSTAGARGLHLHLTRQPGDFASLHQQPVGGRDADVVIQVTLVTDVQSEVGHAGARHRSREDGQSLQSQHRILQRCHFNQYLGYGTDQKDLPLSFYVSVHPDMTRCILLKCFNLLFAFQNT